MTAHVEEFPPPGLEALKKKGIKTFTRWVDDYTFGYIEQRERLGSRNQVLSRIGRQVVVLSIGVRLNQLYIETMGGSEKAESANARVVFDKA
jgi:hypothetical protein